MTDQKDKAAVCCTGPISGGAGSVCCWTMQALSEKYDVDVFSFHQTDLSELDVYYGTKLSNSNIRCLSPLRSKGISSRLAQGNMPSTLKKHLLMKSLKKKGMSDYKVVFADFEVDLGVPAVQYIHYPLCSAGDESSFALGGFPDSKFRRLYRRCIASWSGFDREAMTRNVMIANSEYTASMCRRIYKIDHVQVVYPPVTSDFPEVDWQSKANDFIAISRMMPYKKLEDAISIVREVRNELGKDVVLNIVAGGAYDKAYRNKLLKIADRESWIKIHEDMSRDDLNVLTSSCMYGIHTMEGEHFGIAVAEMVLAGCIPFVHNIGGPAEIVGNRDELQFANVDDAVNKIHAVLKNGDLQNELHKSLESQKELFSTEVFTGNILSIADQ